MNFDFLTLSKNTPAKLPKRVLFVSSTVSDPEHGQETIDYFSTITTELAGRFQARHRDYDLVIKIPGGDHPVEDQLNIIEAAIAQEPGYESIFISPIDVRKLAEYAGIWLKEFPYRKLFFIDQGLNPDNVKDFGYAKRTAPPYVQADWLDGGRKAAESMLGYFNKRGINNPSVVLVKGKFGSEKRLEGFTKCFEEHKSRHKNFNYSTSEIDGQYSRVIARDRFRTSIAGAIENQNLIHGVFAANDEMALGVRDALRAYEAYEDYPASLCPIIIGFDGIREAKIHVYEEDKYLYDTIDVCLRDQIEILMDFFERVVVQNGNYRKVSPYRNFSCKSYRQQIENERRN
jgi:ABC-type sugar transport system substrate-binding protein